jgi:hypothetical protein
LVGTDFLPGSVDMHSGPVRTAHTAHIAVVAMSDTHWYRP